MKAESSSYHAGQSLRLALRVEARGNNAGDWSHWLQPVIVIEPKARSGAGDKAK